MKKCFVRLLSCASLLGALSWFQEGFSMPPERQAATSGVGSVDQLDLRKIRPHEFDRLPRNFQEAIRFAPTADLIKKSSYTELADSITVLRNSKLNKDEAKSPRNCSLFWLISEANPASSLDVLSRQQNTNLWEVFARRYLPTEMVPLVALLRGTQVNAKEFRKLIDANRQLANYLDFAGRTVYHLALRFALEPAAGEDWPLFLSEILRGAPVPVDLKDKYGNTLFHYVCALALTESGVKHEWLPILDLIGKQSYMVTMVDSLNYRSLATDHDLDKPNIFGFQLGVLMQRNLERLHTINGVSLDGMQAFLGFAENIDIHEPLNLGEFKNWAPESPQVRLNKMANHLAQMKLYLAKASSLNQAVSEEESSEVEQLILDFYANFKEMTKYEGIEKESKDDLLVVLPLIKKFLNPNCVAIVLSEMAKLCDEDKRIEFFFGEQKALELINRGISFFLMRILLGSNFDYAERVLDSVRDQYITLFEKDPEVKETLAAFIKQGHVQGYDFEWDTRSFQLNSNSIFGWRDIRYGNLLLLLARRVDLLNDNIIPKSRFLITGAVLSLAGSTPSSFMDHYLQVTLDDLLEMLAPSINPTALIKILESSKRKKERVIGLKIRLASMQDEAFMDYVAGLTSQEIKKFSASHVQIVLDDVAGRLKQSGYDGSMGAAVRDLFNKMHQESGIVSIDILRQFIWFFIESFETPARVYFSEMYREAVSNAQIKELFRQYMIEDECGFQEMLMEADEYVCEVFADDFADVIFLGDGAKDEAPLWGSRLRLIDRYLDRTKAKAIPFAHSGDKQKRQRSSAMLLRKYKKYYPQDLFGNAEGGDCFFSRNITFGRVLPVEFFNLYFQDIFQESVNYNSKNLEGDGVLHSLLCHRSSGNRVAKSFIFSFWAKNGANVHIQNAKGETPLHLAIRLLYEEYRYDRESNEELLELMKVLLRYGADPYFVSTGLKSPMQYFEELKNQRGFIGVLPDRIDEILQNR